MSHGHPVWVLRRDEAGTPRLVRLVLPDGDLPALRTLPRPLRAGAAGASASTMRKLLLEMRDTRIALDAAAIYAAEAQTARRRKLDVA